MERNPKVNARLAFLGTPAPGALPPPVAPVQPAAGASAQAADRSTLSQRPLERMLQPGAPRLKQMQPAQTPSLQDAASDKDWLDWATTFG